MNEDFENAQDNIKKVLGNNFAWVIISIVIIILIGMNIVKTGRVSGGEVGILLDKVTGKFEIIEKSGVTFYNGITKDFFKLNKKIQILEMTENVRRGDRQEKDDLKVKTVDGSDVFLDLEIQYQIIPSMADIIVQTSGLDDNYKTKWIRDYSRSICRNYLGELTTEEFYDSSKRKSRINEATIAINAKIEKQFGIRITNITPQDPHFYKEYEAMIKEKKIADQAVLEEKSKALAAKQKQQTLIVEITNKKNVSIEQFKGKMQEKLIAAGAEAERVKKSADAYNDKIIIGAGANLYKKQRLAIGILAEKRADAKGIEAMKLALEGEGGRNMVKMEYAKKLKSIQITGKPYTIDGHIGKLELNKADILAKELSK